MGEPGRFLPTSDLRSVYTIFKGYAGQTGALNRYMPTEFSASVWETFIMHNEWSVDLPARETMQIKGYLAHARDSATFSALRLDLINDDIVAQLAEFHGEGGIRNSRL